MDNVTIRPLAEGDHDEWRRLWTAYLEFYKTTVTEEVYATAWERLLSDDPIEFRGLIAEVDGSPVGLSHYVFHRSLWTVEDVCYLMDLFVDPHMRGKGVGRALIDAAFAAAMNEGAGELYWLTQEFNYNGRMLYDQVAERTPFIVYAKTE